MISAHPFSAPPFPTSSAPHSLQFLSKWNAEMPHQCTSYTPPEALLAPLCLAAFEGKVGDDILSFFPSSSLPVEPSQRFQRLFKEREQWKEVDISPFLDDICKENENCSSLLLKYAVYTDGVWIEKPPLA